MTTCSICGGVAFTTERVLTPDLIAQWALTAGDVATIETQQGLVCDGCGGNLRARALSDAIRAAFETMLPLARFVETAAAARWRILDVNGVPGVSDMLARLPRYRRRDFPGIDLHSLDFPDRSFDLVLHSDTLEHVSDPQLALAECRRVLVPGGVLCFTIPLLPNRLTRTRAGLPPSYHGAPGRRDADFLVHTEFGADAWTLPLRAGFQSIEFNQIAFPIALALTARCGRDAPVGGPDATGPIERPPRRGWRARLRAGMRRWRRRLRAAGRQVYDQDGLLSLHNHDFMTEPGFLAAYRRGIQAAGRDYQWHWRVHVALWAARSALAVEGAFVECGVNRGFMSSAIMHHLDWDETGRTFHLLDSFAGVEDRSLSDEERASGVARRAARDLDSGFYTTDASQVRANFAEWRNHRIIVGRIPETLDRIDAARIAFLHIDLNCALPEVAALSFLWPRLSAGAFVLLDDYAYLGFEPQKRAMDQFADAHDIAILSLPTGQGLIIKPGPPKERK